jgi:DNA invertase Pin-like site-specific DNA recombinase
MALPRKALKSAGYAGFRPLIWACDFRAIFGGGMGCERLYVEKASGAHRDRPELKAALGYMRPGDTLVVWRLSRLARSLRQIIETAHDLEQKNQALKVLTRNIDTGTPEGRLFFHITAAFDEFQRELIVENTRAGLAAARKRGRRGGRPRVLDKERIRVAEAMLKDTTNYPFVGDVIDHLRIGRTVFYRYFPPDRIRELRNQPCRALLHRSRAGVAAAAPAGPARHGPGAIRAPAG